MGSVETLRIYTIDMAHASRQVSSGGVDKQRPLQNVQFCSSSRKAKILTTGIYWIFRGLKFEPDLSACLPVRVRTQTGNAQAGAEIGQKGTLCKGLGQMVVIEHQAIGAYTDIP